MLPETFWGRIQYLLQQYGSSFLSGAGNTMIIAIVGTFLGCLIGFIVGIIQTIPVDKRDSAVKKTLVGFFKFIMACYVEFFRGTPMMVQAMFIYYGSAYLFNINMSMRFAAFFVVSINTGAYMAETVRGGILSVDEGQTEAAKAIMTTDTKKKEVAVTFMAGDTEVTIGGMAKGSGMIHPNMCTMLAFITTDAKISKKALQAAMSSDVEDTYNMISVDGDTSTNDTALLLANGMAGNEKIKEGTPEFDAFKEALHYVNETLAKAMAGDGEGATALFEVKVVGAQTKEQAKVLAKSVVCSNLTKAAIAGHDANWGRILCAMGYSGAKFDPEQVDLFFESSAGKLQIIANGTATDYSEEKATEILSQEKVTAIADLKAGDAEATAWGCDLTHGYIDINADYRS